MKNRRPKDEEPHGKGGKLKGSPMASTMHQKKKNMKRLGGGSLSLGAFAGMKSTPNRYNPALIKKQREFHKNAKYVGMYKKKSLNQQKHLSVPQPSEHDQTDDGKLSLAGNKEHGDGSRTDKKNRTGSRSLQELYEKRREEEEGGSDGEGGHR